MPPDVRRPRKEVDVDLLVFVERYVVNLLKWDLVTYFAQNPDNESTAQDVARAIGRSPYVVRSELGDLALLGVLERSSSRGEPGYNLTSDPYLRGLAFKFADYMATSDPML
ncbi:MAG: hypothetical protein ACE5H9_15735 [Anaerolineae bacterium]